MRSGPKMGMRGRRCFQSKEQIAILHKTPWEFFGSELPSHKKLINAKLSWLLLFNKSSGYFCLPARSCDMTRCFYVIAVVFVVSGGAAHSGDNRLSLPPAVNYSPKLPSYEPSPKYQAPVFDPGNAKREMDKYTRDILDKRDEAAEKKFRDDLKRYDTTSPDYSSYSEPGPEPPETKQATPRRAHQLVHADWKVEKNRTGKPCVALSYPQIALTSEIVSTSTGRMGFGGMSVSMSPDDLSRNSVKFELGYTHAPDQRPVATIHSQTFQLVAKKDRASPSDANTESGLLKAMKTGEAMIVRGVSSEGMPREDRYSLIGFTSAYNTLALMCR